VTNTHCDFLIPCLHQEACVAARDACSINVTVTDHESGLNYVVPLVMGSSVGELEDKISEMSEIHYVGGSSRVCFVERHAKDIRNPPPNQEIFLRGELSWSVNDTLDQEGLQLYMAIRKKGSGKGLGKGDIGMFVANQEAVFNRNMPVVPATESPGHELLVHPDAPSFVSPGVVSAIALACGGRHSAKQPFLDRDDHFFAAVSPAACLLLRQLVERAHAYAISVGNFISQLPSGDSAVARMSSCQV
jgi:hypothetical protein